MVTDEGARGRPVGTRSEQSEFAWCTMHDLATAMTRETDVVFLYFDVSDRADALAGSRFSAR